MEKKLPGKTNGRVRGVAHHSPSRTRYRLARQHRNVKTLNRIRESIVNVPGVSKVEFNERTGSVLVLHEEKPEILALLDNVLNGVAVDLFEELVEVELGLFPGVSILANFIKSRSGTLNQSVARLTYNYLDLKTLVPIAFLAGGIYQASKTRAWWNQVPAWVLFYYAFDSYLKFHNPNLSSESPNLATNEQNSA